MRDAVSLLPHTSSRPGAYRQLITTSSYPNPFSGSILKHFRISSGCADSSTRSAESANVRYRPTRTNKKQKHINPLPCVWGDGISQSVLWLFLLATGCKAEGSLLRGRKFSVLQNVWTSGNKTNAASLSFGGRRGPFHRLVLNLRISGPPLHTPSRCTVHFTFTLLYV
jgi:hypothetical protein